MAEMAVQRRLRGLPGIQAGKPIKPRAIRLRHRIHQPEAQRQLARLRLAVGQQLGGFARAHLQRGERGTHVHAVHRVGTGHQLIGQLDDAHQRMRGTPARQRLGVVAHRVGQPAIGIQSRPASRRHAPAGMMPVSRYSARLWARPAVQAASASATPARTASACARCATPIDCRQFTA